ncbi:MAG: KamA family radical SAM protein, partial [Candidatus Eremiobacteraeota bacterium]|nr:KamA family radical SAM protein [Candidatus Eremiobacteraeota bacterium]
ERAPMAVRVSPYAISLINWSDPYSDPIRTQFIPVASRLISDHPRLTLDSLHEQDDSPIPGLVHRYVDKALFLPLAVCPVYCRFCTRSYAIGPDTEKVDKVSLAKTPAQWQDAFQYISERPELEDIVVSGGDAYQLPPKNLELIGNALLDVPHVRRMRIATKGPAIMPMKLLTHPEWVDALTAIVERGRKAGKEVVLHTHFNSPNEITWITEQAMRMLFERGIVVRNQSVLIRGVNDDPKTMRLLVKRLGHLNVHPYYVYMHDLVRGVEDLRTTVQCAIDIEKFVRGSTAGFNTPTFVCDAPGGGGKRDVHSYDFYDRENGIAVYSAPSVKPGQAFVYFDPIDKLAPDVQARWIIPELQDEMIRNAIRNAGIEGEELVLA